MSGGKVSGWPPRVRLRVGCGYSGLTVGDALCSDCDRERINDERVVRQIFLQTVL